MSTKSIAYPPGGLLIWIIIYLELITFGMALAALAYYGAAERSLFHHDSQQLNKGIATANTILLLSSGFLVAKGVQMYKTGRNDDTARFFLWAILAGLGFLALKGIEYYIKLEAGLGMDYSSFFMFYWLLTGFHWIHVLVGLIILVILRRSVLKEKGSTDDLEAGAAFWHMCDLIWLLLFPVLYLLF